MPYITQLERLYQQISQPSPPETKPAPVTVEKPALTRADVDAILQHKRGATPEELEYVIAHSKEFSLSDWQRDQVCCDLAITAAQRARQVNGRRDNPSEEFISKVLGYASTPHGLIDRAWVHEQMRAGAQVIARCKNHRPPNCQCWSASRVTLWQAQANGEKTPEGWCAARIYAFLEELELSSRPDRPGV